MQLAATGHSPATCQLANAILQCVRGQAGEPGSVGRLERMPDAFVVLWTLERCKWLQRVKDVGPLEVVFGGPHTSQPSVESVRPGDTIYPIAVMDGTLHLIGRVLVASLMPPSQFVRERLGLSVAANEMWDTRFQELKRSHPEIGHRFPMTCAEVAAVGEGTSIRLDRILPGSDLAALRLGPKPGREQPIRGVEEGRLKNNFSFQGHVRRLSPESATIFARQFEND